MGFRQAGDQSSQNEEVQEKQRHERVDMVRKEEKALERGMMKVHPHFW
jgi:hypothetical protein